MVRLVQFSVGDSKDVRIGVEESDGGAVVDVTDAVGCDSMVALLRREDGIASAVAAAAADGATKHEKGSFKLLVRCCVWCWGGGGGGEGVCDETLCALYLVTYVRQ